MTDANDFILKHYGVPGMKWGKRKSGRITKSQSFESSEARAIAKKSPKQMSNKDLEKLNKRMGLEQNLRALKTRGRGYNRAKAGLTALLATGTLAAGYYTLVKSPAGQALLSSGKKFMASPAVVAAAAKPISEIAQGNFLG